MNLDKLRELSSCDGCARGLPLVGEHHYDGKYSGDELVKHRTPCTAKREEGTPRTDAVVHNHISLARVSRELERDLGEVLEMAEFIWQRVGMKEGEMCPSCYRFKREGHKATCHRGKRIAEIRRKVGKS